MENVRALVSEELDLLEFSFNNILAPDNLIYADIDAFIRGKSKRIRSLLSLLYLKMNGIKIKDDIIKLLTSVELIHNASLLHDDVIDNSSYRRGNRTLFDKYGSKLSVLSGDYILSLAANKLLKLNNTNILNVFFDTTKAMSEAEIEQYLNRNSNITLNQYINIVTGKTASLFSACMSASAILANINIDIAQQFGTKFGILFQISNDMEPESEKNDIANGVKTIIDILGIEKTLDLKDNYKEELSRLLTHFPENKYKKGIEDLIELL